MVTNIETSVLGGEFSHRDWGGQFHDGRCSWRSRGSDYKAVYISTGIVVMHWHYNSSGNSISPPPPAGCCRNPAEHSHDKHWVGRRDAQSLHRGQTCSFTRMPRMQHVVGSSSTS